MRPAAATDMDPPITNNTSGPIEVDGELRRGPWTLEEDTLLTHYIARHGEGRWNMLAKCAGLKRTGKSCRLRWLNYLKPDIKRGNLTPQEQLLILELHSKWGNRWSKIAQHLPGRTDNEIKNYWRTRVQKQARQLNIESNSNRFLDAVRCYWMPRLLQKVEQQTSSSSPSSSYSSSSRSGSQSSVPCQSAEYCTLVPSLSTFPQLANKTADNSNQSTFETSTSLTNNTIQSMYPTYFMEQTEMVPQNLTSPNAYAQTYFNNSNQSYSNIEGSAGYNNDMDMEGFGLASTSAVGSYDGTGGEGNWMMCDDETTDNLWNMDDIWQFRDQMGN